MAGRVAVEVEGVAAAVEEPGWKLDADERPELEPAPAPEPGRSTLIRV